MDLETTSYNAAPLIACPVTARAEDRYMMFAISCGPQPAIPPIASAYDSMTTKPPSGVTFLERQAVLAVFWASGSEFIRAGCDVITLGSAKPKSCKQRNIWAALDVFWQLSWEMQHHHADPNDDRTTCLKMPAAVGRQAMSATS